MYRYAKSKEKKASINPPYFVIMYMMDPIGFLNLMDSPLLMIPMLSKPIIVPETTITESITGLKIVESIL